MPFPSRIPMTASALSPLASHILTLRRGTCEPFDAALVPPDATAAMAVQAEVTHALGERIGGWKVGVSPDGVPFGAPMYASGVLASPATLALGAYVVIEMEIAVRLARDLPAGTHARETIVDAVGEVIAGIEVIRGRMGEPPAVPFNAFLADNGANLAYVTGGTTRDVRSLDLKALPARLTIDGEVVHEKAGGHPQGDPIEPIRLFLARWPAAMGGLRAGQVITTGSLNKPVRLTKAARIEVAIEGLGRAELTLSA